MSKPTWDLSLPSLFEHFKDKFMVGNILSPHDFDDPDLLQMFTHHYNAVTAQNEMKPVYITPAPGVYNFTDADMMVAWAKEKNIRLIGHTLIWHGQCAPWLNKNEKGEPITRAEAKRNMEAFIHAYAGRYRGQVYSWDVINEALRDIREYDGNWKANLRQNEPKEDNTAFWFLAYANGADPNKNEAGADYIFDAFYLTRKHDPAAILYYNDYNEDVPAKRDAIADMVEDINNQWKTHPDYDNRLLIEGIGMQSHHNHVHININNLREAIKRFAQTGARIAITELDFTFGNPENPAIPLSKVDAAAQADYYRSLFALYAEYSHYIERVSFWAKNDGQSWRKWGSPVLFDAAGAAKPAFHKVFV